MYDNLAWSGLDPDEEWTEPDFHGDSQDDFGVPNDTQWRELSEDTQEDIADNFLLGTADADTFGALDLPVVDPEGDVAQGNDQLSKKGLQAADSYAMRAEGYSEAEKENADEMANRLLDAHF